MIFDRHIKFDNEHEVIRFDQNKCTYEFAHKIKELPNIKIQSTKEKQIKGGKKIEEEKDVLHINTLGQKTSVVYKNKL